MAESPLFQFFRRVIRDVVREGIREILKSPKSPLPNDPPQKPSSNVGPKNHPWRVCPIGKHQVREHPLHVPVSEKNPDGLTLRDEHCRANPSRHETYTALELREIARGHFESLRQDPNAMPVPDALGFPHGNDYDLLIAGWTKFWNEILEPSPPLSPDLVKALIATESGFETPKDVSSKDGAARGLIQITENTRKILQDKKGELKDHLIILNEEQSRTPETNIAAGVRWLHHKRFLAQKKLKRSISWEEAVEFYKGIHQHMETDPKSKKIAADLKKYLAQLKRYRK